MSKLENSNNSSSVATKSFAVIGNPVEHSQSPLIHQSFAKQFGFTLEYDRILANDDDFDETVNQFFAAGGSGLNITTPFKALAANLASNNCSKTVKFCNSANTLYLDPENNSLRAESTDGLGWARDVRRLKIQIEHRSVLVIGAGGVAQILVEQLVDLNAKLIHVCNRTESRAKKFEKDRSLVCITSSSLEDIPDKHWDLIINTLSVGWSGEYPTINARVAKTSFAYDLNYGHGADSFRKWFIATKGIEQQFYTGWGMLVEQAALSFNYWWGKTPNTQQLIEKGPP